MKHTLTTLAALLLICLGMSAETRVTLHKAGTLASQLSQVQQDTITNLVIEGPINSADIRLLRRMAGYREHEGDKAGRLRTLDLRKARITSDKEPYLVLDIREKGLTIDNVYKSHGIARTIFHDNPLGINTSSGMLHDSHVVLYTLGDTCTTIQEAIVRRPNNDDIIHLGNTVTEATKKFMRKNNLMHIPGHKLVPDGESYLLKCFLEKNTFSADFFYDCPTIEAVSVPENAKVNENLIVLNNTIRYYQFQ